VDRTVRIATQRLPRQAYLYNPTGRLTWVVKGKDGSKNINSLETRFSSHLFFWKEEEEEEEEEEKSLMSKPG